MGNTVIKAGDVKPLARGMFRMDLRDIASRNEALLVDARAEAGRILEDARAEAARLREAAEAEGRREGRAEGLSAGAADGREAALIEARARFDDERAALSSALQTLLEEFSERREALMSSARRDVVVLAVTIARRMLARMSAWPVESAAMAAEACREALAILGGPTEATMRLHPDDRAALERLTAGDGSGTPSALSAVMNAVTASRHIQLRDDASVGRGGARVATANSEVDASLSGRVDRIADELVADWRERGSALGL